MIASPEYNGSIPAAFKNVIDWISRVNMKFLGDKPVLLLSTSPGKNGGATNLAQMAKLLPWWGAQLVENQSFGNFNEIYDSESNKVIGDAAIQLQELAAKLENAIETVAV